MEDERIVAGLRVRERVAIEQFWRKYYDRIYPICAHILGSGQDARDLTVDILVEFIECHVQKLSSPRAVFSFLKKMAVRRSMRARKREKSVTELEVEDHACGGASPEERAELNLLMPLLQECFKKMTPKAQASLRLKYTRKISNEKIGELVGGSKSYIGRLLKQGRGALKKCIENKVKQMAALPLTDGKKTGAPLPVVALETVDRLLSARPLFDSGECEMAGRIAEALEICNRDIQDTSGDGSGARTDSVSGKNTGGIALEEWVDAHLKECDECREWLFLLLCSETNRETPKTKDVIPIGKPTRRIPWKVASIAAAFVMGLALLFVFKDMGIDTPEPGEGLTIKGRNDGFYVAIERNNQRFTLRPLDRLAPNDKLGLFYTTKKSGYLAVFSRDQAGETALLYPTVGTVSAPISSGYKVPLEDGGVVAEGEGCEWVMAVFSSEPLELESVASQIKRAKSKGKEGGCQLDISVPKARAIRVIPVKR